MSTGPRPRRRRVALILLTAIFSGLLLELGSWAILSVEDGRAFWPSRYQDERNRLGEADPDLFASVDRNPAWRPAGPGSLHPFLGYAIDDPQKPWGVLDPSPIHHRSSDALIVAVVGGSVASRMTAAAADDLAKALQRAPRFKDKKITVVNLALDSFKQPQQLMMLNYMLVAGGELDILVNLDGFNEITQHPIENEPKRVSYLYPNQWELRRAKAIDQGELRLRGELVELALRRRATAEELSVRPLRWSMTANLVWRIADLRLVGQLVEARSRLLQYKTKAPNVGPPAPYSDEAGMYAAMAALWQRGSVQLDRLCRVNGIRYYHFLQPNQYVEGSKPMNKEERALAFNPAGPYRAGVTRGYPLLRQIGGELREGKIHFRDLTMLFADRPEPLYSDDCCHFNQAGSSLLAQTIGDTIAADDPELGDR